MDRPNLPYDKSKRICIIFSLFHIICSNDELKVEFTKMNFPHFLLPFPEMDSNNFENEQTILSILGIYGQLLKSESTEIFDFFKDTTLINSLLKIIEKDKKISKLIATCTLQKILSVENILDFMFNDPDLILKIITITFRVLCEK